MGKKEESITRPVKIKFHNLSVKNGFMHHLSKLKNVPSEFNNFSIKHDMTSDERSRKKELFLKAKDLNNDSLTLQKTSERPCVGQKNSESEKKGKSNYRHGKQQLKIWYTNIDVFTMNKLHELFSRITDEFPDIICTAEVKPKNFKRTLSLVKCNIVGYNTEALNIVQDIGRGMLLFIKNDIKF